MSEMQLIGELRGAKDRREYITDPIGFADMMYEAWYLLEEGYHHYLSSIMKDIPDEYRVVSPNVLTPQLLYHIYNEKAKFPAFLIEWSRHFDMSLFDDQDLDRLYSYAKMSIMSWHENWEYPYNSPYRYLEINDDDDGDYMGKDGYDGWFIKSKITMLTFNEKHVMDRVDALSRRSSMSHRRDNKLIKAYDRVLNFVAMPDLVSYRMTSKVFMALRPLEAQVFNPESGYMETDYGDMFGLSNLKRLRRSYNPEMPIHIDITDDIQKEYGDDGHRLAEHLYSFPLALWMDSYDYSEFSLTFRIKKWVLGKYSDNPAKLLSGYLGYGRKINYNLKVIEL